MDNKQKDKSKKEKKRQKIAQKQFKKKEGKEEKEENKKKKEDNEDNNNDQSQSNPDINFANVQPQQQQNIQVSFCVAQVTEDYYHSLKTIMRRYSEITSSSLSSIVDAVISHHIAANIVIADDQEEGEDQQQEEEEDEENAYSIISILDQSQAITHQLKQIAISSCKKHTNNAQIANILQDKSTYLLINERLPNLPSFLIPSIHQVLISDMEKKGGNIIKYLLCISEIQYEGSEKLDDYIFAKWEDYEMCKRSKLYWVGENVQCRKKKVQMKRLYWLIDWKSYIAAAKNLNTYLDE